MSYIGQIDAWCHCTCLPALVVLAACAATPPAPNPLDAPPVDVARAGPSSQIVKWPVRTAIAADLDAAGQPERLCLAADVQLAASGAPLWEDGHRWAVYVDDGPEPTLLYAAFVPNGHVEVAVLTANAQRTRHVLVVERTPQQTRSLVVAYERPGSAKLISAAHYQVDQWLPSLTR